MEPSQLNETSPSEQTITIGRYVLHREIAHGGMATIHFGRLLGDEGFSRIVAVKRLHAELAQDEQFVSMFLSEARIASRVQHPNVVPVLDVATVGQEVILVQEYVHGVPLDVLIANIRRDAQRLPTELAVAIACQLLAGLQATHDTVDELGQPMHIVHRDVSPQNVMIAFDGSARLLDFGIATAGIASQVAGERTYKGKLAYSAPEQLQRAATPQSDIYSASVLLWELLVGERMHGEKKGAELVPLVLSGARPGLCEALAAQGRWQAVSENERAQLEVLEPIVQKGLAMELSERWSTAREMEEALAARVAPAPARALAEWAALTGGKFLAHRARVLAAEEQSWRKLHPLEGMRLSDSGLHSSARSARNSTPPDASEAPAPAAKRLRRVHILLITGASVALASAIALLVPPSPASHQEVRTQREAAPRMQERVGAQAPALEPGAPQTVPEPAAVAPLALPARTQPATRPPQTVPTGSPTPSRAAASMLGVTAGSPTPATGNAPPAIRTPVKESAAPADPQGEKPKHDCAVPYYYEGTKKIFKSACI